MISVEMTKYYESNAKLINYTFTVGPFHYIVKAKVKYPQDDIELGMSLYLVGIDDIPETFGIKEGLKEKVDDSGMKYFEGHLNSIAYVYKTLSTIIAVTKKSVEDYSPKRISFSTEYKDFFLCVKILDKFLKYKRITTDLREGTELGYIVELS